MKKSILFLFSALFALTAFASGTGDGSSKQNAIEFSWIDGNEHPGGGAALWYRVPLDPIYDEEDPTLALYLTNLSYNTADVTVSAVFAGSEESRNYAIEARKDRIWSQSAKMLVRMKTTEIYVQLTSSERIKLSASVFDAEDADETCTSATEYNWNDHNVSAGNRWYKINLSEVRANNEEIQITYTATEECELNSTISPNCPSTGLTGDAAVIPAGGSYTHVISRALIQNLAESEIYLKVENYKRVSVHTERVGLPVVDNDFNYTAATEGELLTDYEVSAAGQSYFIALDNLKRKKLQPELAFVNDSNKTTVANVKVYIAFSNTNDANYTTQESKVIVKEITVPVGETSTMDFEKNIIDGLNETTAKYIYVKIVPSQDIMVRARLKHIHEGDACKNSQTLSWNSTTYQDGETTVWYAIDVTEAKNPENPQNIVLTVTNRSSQRAYVTADVAFECPYIDLQSVSRQMSANQVMTKTITYSMFGMMSADKDGNTIVYVGVTTDQPIKVDVQMVPVEKHEADDKCLNATEFDWTYGHTQSAGDSIWYKVGVNDMRNSNLIPEVIIVNRGRGQARIYGELSLDCPDSIANDSRTLTLGAGATYTKQIARDYFRNIAADTVYILLTSNQDFSFRVNQIREDEGASCASATLFNWVSGNDQEAETTVWYKMDLKEVHAAQGKQIRALIQNLSRTEKTDISGLLAATCPCETPQAQRLTLGAGENKERVLARSMFETFGDTLYFRITTSTKIHFEAHLEDADPFDTIYVCSEANGATEIKFDQEDMYVQTVDTAWYFVVTEPILNITDKTPQIRVLNGSAAQTIKAEVAYHCPVVEAMQSKSQAFAANQELTKTIERSLAEQVADKDTIYIRLIGTGSFQFEVKMIDPNTGNDCQHAVVITPEVPVYTQAGETAWYKFNAGKYGVESAEDKIRMILGNMNGVAGKVSVTLYDACEGEVMQQGSATLQANAVRQKELMCEQLTGLSSDWLYLHIYTEQNDSLLLKIIPREPIDTIWACQDAVPFAINTDYYQKAGDTVWYSVNVKDIRENTMGDATLTVNNLSNATNALLGHMTWVCPVAKEMTSKGQTIEANGRYVRVIERANFSKANGHDIAYVRVISPEAMKFRLDLALAKGDECSNPVEFDWLKGNTNPKGECVWYNVRMVKDTVIDGKDTTTLIVPEGMDLQLNIKNLSDVKTTASASIRFECNEKPIGEYDYSFTANELKDKVMSRRLLESTNPTSLVINFCSQEAMHIYASFVSSKTDTLYDTIRVNNLCNEDLYYDNIPEITKEVIIDINDSSTLMWNDTVSRQVGTMMVDSIYTIIITPLAAADTVDYNTIPDSVKLVAAQGMVFDKTALEKYLINYYDSVTTAYDSLANYYSIEWKAFDHSAQIWRPFNAVYQTNDTVLSKEATQVRVAYIVNTECATVSITDTIKLNVTPWKEAQWNGVEYACEGASLTWRGMAITADKDSVYRDTIFNTTIMFDTLGRKLPRQLDSIYSYTVTLKQQPELPDATDIDYIFDMKQNSVIAKDSLDDLTVLINGFFTQNYSDDEYSMVQTVVWQRKNLEDGSYADFQVGVNDAIADEAQVVLRYKVTTECDDEIFSDDITYAPEFVCPKFDVKTVTLTWPEAQLYEVYDDSAVIKPVQAAMDAVEYEGTITLYYRYDEADQWGKFDHGDAIEGETGGNIYFYLEVTNECGDQSATDVVTKVIQAPDCPRFDVSTLTLTWPEAYCRSEYADTIVLDAVEAQMELEGYDGTATLSYRYKESEPWTVYKHGDMLKSVTNEKISFKVEVTNDCGDASSTAVVTKTVKSPDMNDADYVTINSLPAVLKYDGWLLMIDLNAIEAKYHFTPIEQDVQWYEMQAGSPNPDPEKDTFLGTGYFWPARDKAFTANYYAFIKAPITETDECGGLYRTVIISKEGSEAPERVRKQVVDGKLYITTEDGETYDAQGQKVER